MEVRAGVQAMGSGRLEEHYATHARRATRLAYLITGDEELARDLVHDAFLRAAGRFQHWRGSGSFGPYIDRIVVNLARDHFRKKNVERRWFARHGTSPAVTTPYDPGDRSELMEALARLPGRQRAAVVLRYYEDMSERQVADTLNVSHGAARSLIARGLATLRTLVEGEHDA